MGKGQILAIDHEMERQDSWVQTLQRYHVIKTKVRHGQTYTSVQIYEKGVNHDQNMTGAGETKKQDSGDFKYNMGMTIKQIHAYISDKVLPILKP